MQYYTKEKVTAEEVSAFLDYEQNNANFEIVKKYAIEPLYHLPNFEWYFYRDVTHICGIACIVEDRVEPDSLHISVLCVDKNYRNGHIGTYIMKDIALKALKMNKKKLTLHALDDAKTFYKKLGFVESDRDNNYHYDL